MVNARHSFAFLWQRLAAALSLVMAASLAPAAMSAPAGGAGAGTVGSRASSGAAVASTASGLAGNVAAVIEGGALEQPLDTPDGAGAKALPLPFRQEIAALRPIVAHPAREAYAAPPTHAARAGPARAPPLA